MTERWKEIEVLFEAALERAPAERAVWLHEACEGDAQLREDVEQLLAAHERTDGILDASFPALPRGFVEQAAEKEVATCRLGPYRLLRELGHGGMGSVYLAVRDDEQFTQRVAVKVLRHEIDADDRVRRFLAERQILASLHHPHIARLYDGGVTEDGRPYFVMEYVEGRPIDRYCDEERLSVEERLQLFKAFCGAVQYAHRNLVVHRDLKPSNILVAEDADGRAHVKLLDFGIAKLLDVDAAGLLHPAPVTRTGMHPMTPEYASPEQVRGAPVTTASDVYQLGVVLYELLTGHRPYRVAGRTPSEVERMICEEVPVPPSTVVTREEGPAATGSETATPDAIGRARDTTVERLQRKLSGDLDVICLTALRKEPERRYDSAEQFAEDIERYLDRRPVRARPDTLSYRVRTFARRHRWGVAAALAFVLLLASYAATVTMQARRIAHERDVAEQVTSFLVGMFDATDPFSAADQGALQDDTLTVLELLDHSTSRVRRKLAGQPEVQATLMHTIGRAYRQLGLYDRAAPLLEDALRMRRTHLGGAHPDVATSLHEWGRLLQQQGRFDRAALHLREALAMRRQLLGPTHPDVAASLFLLAVLSAQQGRPDEAEPLFREALAMRRQLLGEEHPDVATSLLGLGLLMEMKGDYAAAEPLLRESLQIRRQLFGAKHPDVAESLDRLGQLLARRGDHAAAEPLLREALAMRRELFSAGHIDVTESLSNLARLLHAQGDYPAAEKLYREALAMRLKLVGEEHPDVAYGLYDLGRLKQATGDYAAAEQLYDRSLALRRQLLGDEHPDVAQSIASLVALYEAWGKPERAHAYREQLADARTNVAE